MINWRNISPLLILRGKHSRKKFPGKITVVFVSDKVKTKTTQRINSIIREKNVCKLHKFNKVLCCPCQVRDHLPRSWINGDLLDKHPYSDPRLGYKSSNTRINDFLWTPINNATGYIFRYLLWCKIDFPYLKVYLTYVFVHSIKI